MPMKETPGALFVIGDPVCHSRSPAVQNAMIAALGLPFHYAWRTVTAEGLDDFLAWARQDGNCAGFNATMPLKQLLIPHMDELRGGADMIGAINTVCVQDGRLIGYNTDGDGFVAALRDTGANPAGCSVALLGAGGAAKAVAVALARAGAASITVCNRTPAHAHALCHCVQQRYPATRMTARGDFFCAGADLLVNCTNLGMAGSPQFPHFAFLERLPPHAMVWDLIYNPADTMLMVQARARGAAVQNGLPMLMRQAILALEHFSGTAIDPQRVLPMLKAVLQV